MSGLSSAISGPQYGRAALLPRFFRRATTSRVSSRIAAAMSFAPRAVEWEVLKASELDLEVLAQRYTLLLENQYIHLVERNPAAARRSTADFWRKLSPATLPLSDELQTERQLTAALVYLYLEGFSTRMERAPHSLASLEKCLEGMPLYDCKNALLLLSGYPKDLIGAILRVSSVSVYATLERLDGSQNLPRLNATDRLAVRDSNSARGASIRPLEALLDASLEWEERAELENRIGNDLGLLQDLVLLEEITHFRTRAPKTGNSLEPV